MKDIRSYLVDEIGIVSDDTADILKLNNWNEHEVSFCISFNTIESEKMALAENKWPKGCRVRTFHHPSNLKRNLRKFPGKSLEDLHQPIESDTCILLATLVGN